MNKSTGDLFTIEVIKDSLMAIGDEMFHSLERTSMSPIIYEVLDYACGLTDKHGNLLSQGNGVTSFIGMLSPMVQSIIDKFDNGRAIKEGDIFIINNPYVGGGSHLSDVGLVMPIFYEGQLIGFSANKGHWTDVGGKDAGSFTNSSSEIFQEGLQLPGVKLVNEGNLNEAVLDIIRENIRMPQFSIGDMWAQIAALKTGNERFIGLCEKYGSILVEEAISFFLSQGEQFARSALKDLPKGTFHAMTYIEDAPEKGGPYPVKGKITITDEEFICDFRGSHPQVESPVNCSYYGLMASVRVIYLGILPETEMINEGLFKPLKIITDAKSIISAERPAPVSMNFEARTAGAECIWKVLAPLMPDRLSAGHHLSVCSVVLDGFNPDSEEPFLIVEPSVGGWGASKGQDGQRGQFFFGNGETYNVPVEVAETRYGVRLEEYALHCDPAGAGEFIGGSGVIRSYRILSDNQKVSIMFGKHQHAPWGMNEGEEGSNNRCEIIRADGTVEGPVGMLAQYQVSKGDVVRFITATGGGYGNPLNRAADQVRQDVKNGYIDKETAKKVYNVEI